MSRWRDILLIAGLFGGLIAFTIYGPGRSQTTTEGTRGSAHEVGDEGALALQRWLGTIGYAPANLEYSEWRVPDDAAALLILNPVEEPITREHADEVLRWVREGGTLIAVDERPQAALAPNGLWKQLGATTTVSTTQDVVPAEHAYAAQPLLATPPVESVAVHTQGALRLDDPAYVTLLQTPFGPTLIGRQEGRGYLYLAVAAHPFTNAGLREPGSAALILNLLARVPRGATILFDEYHHGFTTAAAAAAPSLRRIILSQWWGWAGLYALAVVGLYIVLTGRRFGKPVPLQRDVAHRSSGEYVESIAQLLQRGGKRQQVALHYRDALKRRVGRPRGINAASGDAAFLRELLHGGAATEQQAEALRRLLSEMARPNLSDADLVRLARAGDEMVDERGQFR